MLSGKVAFVTGATRGIGRAVAERFADAGAEVYAAGRDADALEAMRAYSAHIHPLSLELRDADACKKCLMQCHKEQGQLDILVNNAGIMKDALLGMISEDMLEEMFQINVFAMIRLTQLASRFMKRKKEGSIINLASIIGMDGNAGQSVYAATKGAVIAFTKSAAKELTGDGIRVNAIAPGIIQTDLIKNVPEQKMKERLSRIGMGRIGQPEDVADAALFLAGEQSRYITGQVLRVDGMTVL